MQSIQISTNVELVTMECGECGAIFAMSKDKYKRCEEKGEHWYCPNGHVRIFCTSEVVNLRARLDQLDAEIERTHERLNGALKEVTNKKRQLTRIKNRIHNGVCPVCNRYFSNLDDHQKTQHGTPNERTTVVNNHKGGH